MLTKNMLRVVASIVILLGCFSHPALSQAYKRNKTFRQIHYSRVDEKEFHFGFTVGFNFLDVEIKNSNYNADASYRAEQINFKPGLTLSVISEWNMNKDIGIRLCPGIIIGNRFIRYVNVKKDFTSLAQFKSYYLDIPLYIKYKSKRILNYRPYLIGGMSYRLDLSPHNVIAPLRNEIIKIGKHDYSIELGVGVDFYLSYFKLSTELKLSIGLKDIAIHILDEDYPDYHEYTQAISEMDTRVVTLSFHFE